MRALFDTSAVVPYLIADHPHYEKAVETVIKLANNEVGFFICTHSLSEIFRTLTRGASYLNFTPNKATEAIEKSILSDFEVVDLQKSDYIHVLNRFKKIKRGGPIIYDGLISHAATKIDADYLVTFNAKDFQRVFPENGADLIIPG